jgi:ABC-type transporter Mla subunit MlaD
MPEDKKIIEILDKIDPLVSELRGLFDEKTTEFEDAEEVDEDVRNELDEFESALDTMEAGAEEVRDLFTTAKQDIHD